MRTIAHISDIHFGREDPRLVKGLLKAVAVCGADYIVVSGDLTQRARTKQFKQAREFLEAMPEVPLLVVPGNHDVSTTNLMERFTKPLVKYRKYITREMAPFVADEAVAIAGINTVRVTSTKDGRVNRRQVICACERLSALPPEVVRVVVTHHPMDVAAEDKANKLVGRSKRAMVRFAEAGVDLFLSGHLHAGTTVATSARYAIPGYSAVVAQAGTAVSTRTRGEANGWNLIRLDRTAIAVEQRVWDGARFVEGETGRYRKGADGWGVGREVVKDA